ncbi:transposase domain-containing protein [Streptomyces kaempferi]
MVDEVLGLTGRAERRRRLLPAHAVVYFVLCACSAAPTAQGRRDTGWSCGP